MRLVFFKLTIIFLTLLILSSVTIINNPGKFDLYTGSEMNSQNNSEARVGTYILLDEQRNNETVVDPWVITGTEEILNEQRVINKAITISSGGKLIIKDSLIKVNSSTSPVVITVENGGELVVQDSNFTSEKIGEDQGYNIEIYGTAEINNSDLNYLCSLIGNYTIASCSGTDYKPKYTPGISIYSDNTKITNSRINFAWNTSILIEDSTPTIINNSFTNNLYSITIFNSKVTLYNNHFFSNLMGFSGVSSEISMINSTFTSMFDHAIVGYQSEILLKNVTITNCNTIMYCFQSSIQFEDSTISNSIDLWLEISDFTIINSTISAIQEQLYFSSANISFRNNIIENCNYGITIFSSYNGVFENNTIDSSVAIRFHYCYNLLVQNNTITGNFVGISILSSNITIQSNTISNSTYSGISVYYDSYGGSIKNNMINNNTIGISISNSEYNIINNTIVENHEGISSQSSKIVITDNLIAGNTEWAINITDVDPVLRNNKFDSEEYSVNGQGQIHKQIQIRVNVRDQYGNFIDDSKISVSDKNNNNALGESQGQPNQGILIPVSKKFNSGTTDDFNPFTITALWGNNFGYTTSNKVITITEPMIIDLVLPLPDIYVTNDDIKISTYKTKHGDKIMFDVTIHYYGEQVAAKDIEVSLTADGGVIDRFNVSFAPSPNHQSKNFEIPWEVVAYKDGEMDIQVTINSWDNFQSISIENYKLNYDDNNTAVSTIEVEGYEIDKGGSWLNFGQFCILSILILVILILIILYLILKVKSKAKQKEQKEMFDELDTIRKEKDELKIKKGKKEKKGKIGKGGSEQIKIKGQAGPKTKNAPSETLNDLKKRKSLKDKLAEDMTGEGPKIRW
jgi:parallel beta-helix repeat protein